MSISTMKTRCWIWFLDKSLTDLKKSKKIFGPPKFTFRILFSIIYLNRIQNDYNYIEINRADIGVQQKRDIFMPAPLSGSNEQKFSATLILC